MEKKSKAPEKVCADCIHEFACQMWNIGNIHEMDASGCRNYETVKDSPSYLIGVMDGMAKKKTNADRIRSMSDEELADMFAKFAEDVPSDDAELWLEWLLRTAEED